MNPTLLKAGSAVLITVLIFGTFFSLEMGRDYHKHQVEAHASRAPVHTAPVSDDQAAGAMRGNVDVAPAPQSGRANTAVHQALRKAIDVFNAMSRKISSANKPQDGVQAEIDRLDDAQSAVHRMKRDSAHVLSALGEANPPLHADHKHSFKEHAEYVAKNTGAAAADSASPLYKFLISKQNELKNSVELTKKALGLERKFNGDDSDGGMPRGGHGSEVEPATIEGTRVLPNAQKGMLAQLSSQSSHTKLHSKSSDDSEWQAAKALVDGATSSPSSSPPSSSTPSSSSSSSSIGVMYQKVQRDVGLVESVLNKSASYLEQQAAAPARAPAASRPSTAASSSASSSTTATTTTSSSSFASEPVQCAAYYSPPADYAGWKKNSCAMMHEECCVGLSCFGSRAWTNVSVFLDEVQWKTWETWWLDHCDRQPVPLLHSCWRYRKLGCECEGCGKPSEIHLRYQKLKLEGLSKHPKQGPTTAEYETPDWCCAYQLKLNSFSMHCPDTAACRPSGATGMVYFREATTVEDMQGPLPGLTAG